MGEVWKAEDTKLHRSIALKMLPGEMAVDPERRARFEREARAIAALNHQNVVTVFSVEEAPTGSGSVHFITMELVEGKTLRELIPPDGFSLSELLDIAIPLADAVSSAHRAGITHRDIKPDNIMIDVEGRLRVLDFGLAKLHAPMDSVADIDAPTETSHTIAGRVLGTFAYMSPEQAEGKEVDARSDIFSLGSVLYELATGRSPFASESSMGTLGSILKEEPTAITQLRPSLPRDMARIIRRCLAKDPDRRFQTSQDLRNELEDLREELDSGIHEKPATEPSPRGKRPRWSWVAIFVAMIAVAAIAVMLLRGGSPTVDSSYALRPVTASNAWDSGPCWSPDGRFLAFERMEQGHSDIYVKPIDAGEAVLRAGGPGDQITPRWTPDGRYLTYVSKQVPGTAVMIVPVDGGKPSELTTTNLSTLDFDTVALGDRPWSADGTTLLVSILDPEGQLAIHRVDRASGQAEQLSFPPARGADSRATYSFDNTRIAFAREVKGSKDLMVMPAGGGDPQALLRNEPELASLSWRPSGREIVFVSGRDGRSSVYELDVVSHAVSRLAQDTRELQAVSVSIQNRLAVSPFWHDQFLYVVDLATGESRQLTSHALRNVDARFSPDGSKIVYASDRTGDFELWIFDCEDGSETRFTRHPAVDRKPAWSPDGVRIVFLSNRDGGEEKLYVANTDGRTEARLLVDQSLNLSEVAASRRNNAVCDWSPDGELIAYLAGGEEGPELWTVGAEGQNPRRRLVGVTGIDWYEGSRKALISRRHGTEDELLAVDFETGQEQSLFVGAFQEFDVAPDRSAVSFCYGRGHLAMGLAVLRLVAPSSPDGLPSVSGEPAYVVPTEGTWHVHNGSWSPDARQMLFTHDRDFGDIYELVREQ